MVKITKTIMTKVLSDLSKTHVFIKSHQRKKTNENQDKEELADRIFPKWVYWEQVTLFCYGHYIMSVTKTVLFFFFLSEIENQFFLVCLAPFLLSRGLNLSVVNYQNHGKTQEKIKPTLCDGHHVIDITLQISHCRHYIMDIMTAWL